MKESHIVDRELETLTERLEKAEAALKELEDLKIELKGIKIFLTRLYPEFKTEFPDILKKLTAK